jgi:hypothetical protein
MTCIISALQAAPGKFEELGRSKLVVHPSWVVVASRMRGTHGSPELTSRRLLRETLGSAGAHAPCWEVAGHCLDLHRLLLVAAPVSTSTSG